MLYTHMSVQPRLELGTANRAELFTFLLYVAVMMTAAILLAPKPKQPKKPIPIGIEQFDVPTAEEGRAVQVLFGKRFVASPNVVWYGHLRSTPIIQ